MRSVSSDSSQSQAAAHAARTACSIFEIAFRREFEFSKYNEVFRCAIVLWFSVNCEFMRGFYLTCFYIFAELQILRPGCLKLLVIIFLWPSCLSMLFATKNVSQIAMYADIKSLIGINCLFHLNDPFILYLSRQDFETTINTVRLSRYRKSSTHTKAFYHKKS